MASETGNRNANAEEKPPLEAYQVDALYSDFYRGGDEEGPYKTREQQLQKLEQLDKKEYCPRRLEDVYPNVEVTTPEKLSEQLKQFEQFKKQKEYEEYCESEKSLNDSNCRKQQDGNEDEPEK